MFNDKNYENDFMYDWVIKSSEISKKNRIHSQLLDRGKDDKIDKHNPKYRNENEIVNHKRPVNENLNHNDAHHRSYFKSVSKTKPVKHNYEATPFNDIYPMKERLHESTKFINKKDFNAKMAKDGSPNEKNDHFNEEAKGGRNDKFNFKSKAHYNSKGYIKETMNNSKEYEENQKGQSDNKYFANDQRKLENKAIFARQLQSIKKTITSHFTKDASLGRPPVGGDPKNALVKTDKHEPKATTLAGSGIVGDFAHPNDEYIITSFEKEEPKHSHLLEISKNNNFYTSKDEILLNNKNKRASSGFRTSAAAMFSNQGEGK